MYFDGAPNVQGGGQILKAMYSRITCLHGSGNVVSLFVASLSKVPAIKCYVGLIKKVYGVFGSDSNHTIYTIFKKYATLHNGGREIGLICVNDTCMTGYIIVFLRLVQINNVFAPTISSTEFLNIKLKPNIKEITCVLKMTSFGTTLF